MQDWIIRILMMPFALVYGGVVSIRQFFYNIKLLRASKFDIPIISVGNLSVGGTGKSPHIEFIANMLRQYIDVAILSRGYRRKTEGFRIVEATNTADQVGDEPLQFKRKFPDVAVAVVESRVLGVTQLLMQQPQIKTILLDDAFQHLALTPGLNILLTEYSQPFTKDYLLPAGRLRDWKYTYRRADIIIVTKCPFEMSEDDRERMLEEIKPFPHQTVYFSFFSYGYPYYIFNPAYRIDLTKDIETLLVCGIARTDYLLDYLKTKVNTSKVIDFGDHHYFSNYDVGRFEGIFNDMAAERKIILTTEKDATRLEAHKTYLVEKKIPLFVLPIVIDFHFQEKQKFENHIKNFLLDFKV